VTGAGRRCSTPCASELVTTAVSLFEEHTLAYGLASCYERSAAALGVRQVRVELLDDGGRLLNWRTYLVPVTSGEMPKRVA
jgi:hypothetical protein